MKLSAIIAGAFAAFALAKPAITNTIFDVREGKPFTLTWIGAVGDVTVTLMTGQPSNLKVVEDLTTSGTGGTFTFTPSGYPSGNYAFRIFDSSSKDDPNFSLLFPYVGTGTLSSSKSASASASSTDSVISSGSVVSTTVVSSVTSVASSGLTTATTSASTTTRATATTTRSTATSSPTNVNSASQRYSSPFALVLIAAAAFALFN
ncbi:hypothetical protein B0H67DRAFT_88061 [Lasiosphaeris hirsuta]|uniref:Yeast cell wall synthesis Kre9/Knh1-like N-terminal domain-containing protein n=1 Tax=Lasiosphaeris hirsuta TaxID=260670 RepID=A0AA40BCP0_9PEZI|nr:hypothetical protein B0H67DRAFT_88061 [Lasiosphaeris hirsuta]